MYFTHAVILWIGFLIINITTVIYLVSWTGSGHILYFGIIYLVVTSIGSIFYLRNHVDDIVKCKHCKKEFDRDWF